MLSEFTERSHYTQDFIPAPDITDRPAWEALPAALKAQLIKEGMNYSEYVFPPLTASDYMDFSESGRRTDYERKMSARRCALNALVLAECVENRGRFLKKIVDGIYFLLEESTWCIPAHNSYVRDTPQLPLPDYSRPVLDLFAGETGAVLAMTEYLLRPVLAGISPLISRNIDFRLRERIFTPYLVQRYWWMGDGKQQVNNWTVWITQNVLLAAFTRPDCILPRNIKEQILNKSSRSVDYFLDEYGEDGCCDEGAQYYDRAGISLFHCLDILERVTGDALDDIFFSPKIRNMADYIRKVHITDDCYINFADCSLRAGRRGAGEYLFGKRAGLPALSSFAAADFLCDEGRLLTDELSLYRRLVQIMHWEEMTVAGMESLQKGEDHERPAENRQMAPEDAWFESKGLMVSRDEHLLLAVKAGNNGDSHNHNDVGSFIICKDQTPLFIDLGVETYCRKTFSDRRYEIWTMQSQYHNLPSFDDFVQQSGEMYAASEVSCRIEDGRACLAMELSGAYRLDGTSAGLSLTPDGRLKPKEGADRIRSYRRSASLIKGRKILIQDIYDGELPAVLNLMVQICPCVLRESDDSWTLRFEDLATCVLTGASSLDIEPLSLTDPRLKNAWGEKVYRIRAGLRRQLKLEIV